MPGIFCHAPKAGNADVCGPAFTVEVGSLLRAFRAGVKSRRGCVAVGEREQAYVASASLAKTDLWSCLLALLPRADGLAAGQRCTEAGQAFCRCDRRPRGRRHGRLSATWWVWARTRLHLERVAVGLTTRSCRHDANRDAFCDLGWAHDGPGPGDRRARRRAQRQLPRLAGAMGLGLSGACCPGGGGWSGPLFRSCIHRLIK